MNHTMPNMDESVFRHGDWEDFYGAVVKEDPPNMPVPFGNSYKCPALLMLVMQEIK